MNEIALCEITSFGNRRGHAPPLRRLLCYGRFMEESKRNPKLSAFLSKAGEWRAEFEALRAIVLDCPLTEDLKWGVPCYSHEKRNVVLIHGFKDYCALLFFKGALL